MINEITFLEPKPNIGLWHRYGIPGLGNLILATIMKGLGYDTKVCFMTEKEVLERNLSPDMIALSAITQTAPIAYRLAVHFRQKGIPVVIGGAHASFLPEEVLKYADFCIIGEGEIPLPQLIETLNKGDSLEAVPGLAWIEEDKGDKMNTNPVVQLIEDLDSIPFPDLSLFEYSKKSSSVNNSRPKYIPMQTSRGCPYHCTFCSVTGMFGGKYRYRSPGNVLEEMKRYDSKKDFIIFYDDNFTANKDRTKTLLRKMIDLNMKFQWCAQVRTDIATDPELLDLIKEAGCVTLLIGFESVNPGAFKEMKKTQSIDQMRLVISEIRKRKINLHGMFVFGFDIDTSRSLEATVNFAIKEKIDSAQFTLLTPLPGTQFYYKMMNEGRLLDTQWNQYDCHHVKFKPVHFSEFELHLAMIKAYKRFYSPIQLLKKLCQGNLDAFSKGVYANIILKKWQRIEKDYVQELQRSRGRLR